MAFEKYFEEAKNAGIQEYELYISKRYRFSFEL